VGTYQTFKLSGFAGLGQVFEYGFAVLNEGTPESKLLTVYLVIYTETITLNLLCYFCKTNGLLTASPRMQGFIKNEG
jgi:hypothetical protein